MAFRLKNAVGNMSNSLCVKLHRNNYRYIFSSGKKLVKSHSQIILEKEKSLNFSAETQIDTQNPSGFLGLTIFPPSQREKERRKEVLSFFWPKDS